MLTGRGVHVWPFRIYGSDALAAEFLKVLSPDERERAARFRFERLQRSFILTRGALRILLGHYLETSPAGIQFEYGAKGKPHLAAPSRIEFNVSHSGELALFAFTLDCELGVDVEQIRPMPDMRAIAAQFFHEEEAAELMTLPASRREHAFFLCWTRKEAYIKAIGDGLSAPLDGFRVTLRPGEPARFIHLARDTDAAATWTLHDLDLDLQYAAALAYRDSPRPLLPQPL
ncbi:MAG: 4'-phosphopantetheinyl transferase family protein, partial [Bryobacteraceae bacterium]